MPTHGSICRRCTRCSSSPSHSPRSSTPSPCRWRGASARGRCEENGMLKAKYALLVLLALIIGGSAQADELKLAVGQRGAWDTAITELGNRAGIFKKHGIELQILYTEGGAETQKAVLS